MYVHSTAVKHMIVLYNICCMCVYMHVSTFLTTVVYNNYYYYTITIVHLGLPELPTAVATSGNPPILQGMVESVGNFSFNNN